MSIGLILLIILVIFLLGGFSGFGGGPGYGYGHGVNGGLGLVLVIHRHSHVARKALIGVFSVSDDTTVIAKGSFAAFERRSQLCSATLRH